MKELLEPIHEGPSVKALIVIPTYNEIDNLQALTTEIFSIVPEGVEVLVVDDHSPDGTGDLADVLAEKNPKIHVMHRPRKMGLGTAYVQGFQYGLERGFDVFIEMDSDFSHNPKYLPTMLQEIAVSDVVVGSRYVKGGAVVNWGLGRKVLSRGGSLYARTLLGLSVRDLTGGFNAWRRSVVEAIDMASIRSDGYSFQIEMKYKAHLNGFRLKEFPIVFEDRRLGHSKMNRKIVMEAIVRVALMKWRAGGLLVKSQH